MNGHAELVPLILSGQLRLCDFHVPSLTPSFPVHIYGGRKTGIKYMPRDGVLDLFRPRPLYGERLPRRRWQWTPPATTATDPGQDGVCPPTVCPAVGWARLPFMALRQLPPVAAVI